MITVTHIFIIPDWAHWQFFFFKTWIVTFFTFACAWTPCPSIVPDRNSRWNIFCWNMRNTCNSINVGNGYVTYPTVSSRICGSPESRWISNSPGNIFRLKSTLSHFGRGSVGALWKSRPAPVSELTGVGWSPLDIWAVRVQSMINRYVDTWTGTELGPNSWVDKSSPAGACRSRPMAARHQHGALSKHARLCASVARYGRGSFEYRRDPVR